MHAIPIKKILFVLTVLLFSAEISAQNTIKPEKGYSDNIGVLVSMLDDLKGRIESSVKNISEAETDFLLDENANRLGAMIYHLAATEKYYQLYTFEGR